MTDYSETLKFSLHSCSEIIGSLSSDNSRTVRKLAEECFFEMCRTIVSFGMDPQLEEVSLKSTLEVIYQLASPTPDTPGGGAAKIEAIPVDIARCKMIAMRIVAEKHLNLFPPCRLMRFVDDACAAAKDDRRPVQLLAMDVARVLCERLPVKTLNEYKARILAAAFSSSDARTVVRYGTSEAYGRLHKALVDNFGRNEVKAALKDRFQLLETSMLMKKLRRRRPEEQPQRHLPRRAVQSLEGDEWDDLMEGYDFRDGDQGEVSKADVEKICENIDFKFQHIHNDFAACAFIVAIRALGSVGMFFIEALKRRVDERTGGNINTANARTERLICLDILGMVEKEPNDLWRRQINIPVGMQDFREKFANITPHDRELSTRTGIDTRKAVDTIINLLRPDDQRHFKLVTKKAVKCPNVQCQAINRIASAQTSHDNHFTFALPGGNYPHPYWQYAGRRWEDFGETEKLLTTVHQCWSCRQPITRIRFRERPEKPLPFSRNDPDQNPQHRYMFVFYLEENVNNQGTGNLFVTPQLVDAFHAYPEIGAQKLNTDDEWDCRLVGYGLSTHGMEHIVFRYHYRSVNGDRFYHIDQDTLQYQISLDIYRRPKQSVYFALYQFMNPSSKAEVDRRAKYKRFHKDAWLKTEALRGAAR